MNADNKYIPVLQKFATEYNKEYGITRIGIFGSVARNEQTLVSDVDILVEAPVLSLLSLVGIKRQLENILGVPVDVVRKTDYLPKHFKAKIDEEVIYV